MTYDEETDMYHVYCCSPKENTRMKRKGEPYKSDEDGSYYRVERNQVSFRAPSKGREWTDEQREVAAERLRFARENKSKNINGGE
ncbi:hypothetical protein D3C87_624580 [compost metagenome]